MIRCDKSKGKEEEAQNVRHFFRSGHNSVLNVTHSRSAFLPLWKRLRVDFVWRYTDVGPPRVEQLRSANVHSELISGLLGATKMLSGCTFPVSEANKEVFWEEKGMRSPRRASPVVTNHSSTSQSQALEGDRWGFMLSWVDVLQSRRHTGSQLMFIFREGPPHSFGVTHEEGGDAA